MNRLRILFFGLFGTMSRLPLSALLAADINVVGVVLPANRVPPFLLAGFKNPSAPILSIQPTHPTQDLLQPDANASILELAARHQIPAFAVRDLKAAATITTLRSLSPDLICVSCFPHKLPSAMLQLPRLGCLNLHPSLLPQFRGPAPLFWTFQRGVQQTGATVHWMDEEFDTGDIALQQAITLPDGISGPNAEYRLAETGGQLLLEAVQQAAVGALPRQPQTERLPADPWPRDTDFELHTHWSARHAFNFMRGTAVWKRPYFVTSGRQTIRLRRAIAYQPSPKQNQPLVINGDQIAVQFSDGVLIAVPLT